MVKLCRYTPEVKGSTPGTVAGMFFSEPARFDVGKLPYERASTKPGHVCGLWTPDQHAQLWGIKVESVVPNYDNGSHAYLEEGKGLCL